MTLSDPPLLLMVIAELIFVVALIASFIVFASLSSEFAIPTPGPVVTANATVFGVKPSGS